MINTVPLYNVGLMCPLCDAPFHTRLYDITSGRVRSCGCLRVEHGRQMCIMRQTHGKSHSAEYAAWYSLRRRCLNKSDKAYKNYGGRGITFCDRWNKFENFFADMGTRPAGRSLDRIDNEGNYEPKNCRWATLKQQHNNTRRSLCKNRVS